MKAIQPATLWDQRRILKRRRRLHALLAELEGDNADRQRDRCNGR